MYENFVQLLQKYGVSAYKVAKETGISQATMHDWKTGRCTPKLDKLQKIADYFNVPIEYLTRDPSVMVEAHNEPIYLDEETRDIIDELRTRPEMKVLFSVSKNVTKEDIEATVEILKRMQRNSE
ncbi:MAG: helix-turn-helix transcriptional regulator [Ruminococcus sp.]|nr:helix-turn-helix transcriptional regulator [Ruminococcus sp.]